MYSLKRVISSRKKKVGCAEWFSGVGDNICRWCVYWSCPILLPCVRVKLRCNKWIMLVVGQLIRVESVLWLASASQFQRFSQREVLLHSVLPTAHLTRAFTQPTQTLQLSHHFGLSWGRTQSRSEREQAARSPSRKATHALSSDQRLSWSLVLVLARKKFVLSWKFRWWSVRVEERHAVSEWHLERSYHAMWCARFIVTSLAVGSQKVFLL